MSSRNKQILDISPIEPILYKPVENTENYFKDVPDRITPECLETLFSTGILDDLEILVDGKSLTLQQYYFKKGDYRRFACVFRKRHYKEVLSSLSELLSNDDEIFEIQKSCFNIILLELDICPVSETYQYVNDIIIRNGMLLKFYNLVNCYP